jgi:hypothetical protein
MLQDLDQGGSVHVSKKISRIELPATNAALINQKMQLNV